MLASQSNSPVNGNSRNSSPFKSPVNLQAMADADAAAAVDASGAESTMYVSDHASSTYVNSHTIMSGGEAADADGSHYAYHHSGSDSALGTTVNSMHVSPSHSVQHRHSHSHSHSSGHTLGDSFEKHQQEPPFSPEEHGLGQGNYAPVRVELALSESALLASSLAAQELPEATLELYRKASRQHELTRMRERLQAPLDKCSRGA